MRCVLYVLCISVVASCSAESTPAEGDAQAPTDALVADDGTDGAERANFSAPADSGEVRAGRIGDSSGLLAGPKAEGQVGDVRMDNALVAFVLEDVRRTSGYSYWGGNVTDAAARRPDGTWAPDHFGEAFFGWNLDLFKPESVEIVDDGRVSGMAHVRYVGSTAPFDFADSVIADFLNLDAPELDVVYDYTLGPDDRALTLTVTFQNPRADKLAQRFEITGASIARID